MTDANDLLRQIYKVSTAAGNQSGTPSAEIAGMLVSHLFMRPDDIDRFMREGGEMLIDGTVDYHTGCLSFMCGDGCIRSAGELRKIERKRART